MKRRLSEVVDVPEAVKKTRQCVFTEGASVTTRKLKDVDVKKGEG